MKEPLTLEKKRLAQIAREEQQLAEAAIHLVRWMHEKEINTLVLKGRGAAHLRTLFKRTWKSLHFPAAQFPHVYSLGKTTPWIRTSAQRYHKLTEQNVRKKLEAEYKTLAQKLQDPTQKIAVVDEILDTGIGLHATTLALKKMGTAHVFSAVLGTMGNFAAYIPDFIAAHEPVYFSVRQKSRQLVAIYRRNQNAKRQFLAQQKRERERLKRIGKQARIMRKEATILQRNRSRIKTPT